MTRAQMSVAVAMMADPGARHWGYELYHLSGVRPGVLYPMLTRFLEQGLVTDGWEDPAERESRPRRRYYELTDTGRRELGAVAAAAPADIHDAVARARGGSPSRSTGPALRPRPATLEHLTDQLAGHLDPRRLVARVRRACQTGWGTA